jgi:hypothetical protein
MPSAGLNLSKINVHLKYEPVGARPFLGEKANPNLAAIQQKVRLSKHAPSSLGNLL